MKLVELTALKGGGPVWVNASQVLYVAAAEAIGGASMYGDNNQRPSSRLCFGSAATLDVEGPVGEIIARLTGPLSP